MVDGLRRALEGPVRAASVAMLVKNKMGITEQLSSWTISAVVILAPGHHDR